MNYTPGNMARNWRIFRSVSRLFRRVCPSVHTCVCSVVISKICIDSRQLLAVSQSRLSLSSQKISRSVHPCLMSTAIYAQQIVLSHNLNTWPNEKSLFSNARSQRESEQCVAEGVGETIWPPLAKRCVAEFHLRALSGGQKQDKQPA